VGPTAHELAVLRLLVGRPATREMAHELDIAPFIVKRYTSSFHQKLQVQDRRQAVAPDRTLRLLPIQSDVQERLATDARRAPAYLLPLRRPVPDDCS
jgi:DNA-binding CsgD family transcriptional regulator